ncbi:type VI secretion system baseplate subunit TssK [Providencia vermicola]|uniref:type VI secretion system baseplate subunit TssK n=1 Tax=Providencia TaxID=586 RepID=UPI002348FD77|nr:MULTISPECIES: type VI secretion system baseplate subunit TssK [unclassified Providencia]
MKIYRPLWTDGAFLAPQQFQQQSRWDSYVAEVVAKMGIASTWGVINVEFDESALTLSRVSAQKMVVRFQDGTLIDTALADSLPPVLSLNDYADRQSLDIVLALPLMLANGGNLVPETGTDRPRRFNQEWVKVQDLLGHEQTDIAVLRHEATLRFAHDENKAYMTCPVARLIRNTQGMWEFDSHFIPQLLACQGSLELRKLLSEFMHRLVAKRRRLMTLRRESNEKMADFVVADVSLFWLLNSLNSAEPVLNEFCTALHRHPELLYRELARLAGSLLTFSLESKLEDIPLYKHDQPEQVFPPLFALLNTLLEASLPSRVINIELIKEGPFWKGQLHDGRLREEADFYLSVRSSLPAHLLIAQFPLLCKAGSYDDVADVVNIALNGIPLKPLSHVPTAVPLRLENQYFALDIETPEGQAMLSSSQCAFYVPSTLGDVQLELFAVLRS